MEDYICIVGILKYEEKFIDEWIVYHKMIGIDHFFLYDDDDNLPLQKLLFKYKDFVTVINWSSFKIFNENINNQIQAYTHAWNNLINNYKWVIYLDGDEFINLKKHNNVKEFLKDFDDKPSIGGVSLNWYVFGHNGYYDNTYELVTSSLIRRMYLPSKRVKTFSKVKNIIGIDSAHQCKLSNFIVDANKKIYNNDLYSGKTNNANINHYQCRSFLNWMNRLERGDVNIDNLNNIPKGQEWRHNKDLLLQTFVQTVAKDKNEYIDENMLKYTTQIQNLIKRYEINK